MSIGEARGVPERAGVSCGRPVARGSRSIPARIRLTVALAVLCQLAATPIPAPAQESEAKPFAFEVASINEGLPAADPPLQLDTPRAALETFLDAIREGNFDRAAHVLNLNAIPADEQAESGPLLAMKLAFLLRRNSLVDWALVPDRPDARMVPGAVPQSTPYVRRTIELGELELLDRPVPISLQRFMVTGSEPVWLFSKFAVDRVDEIYAEMPRGLLDRWMSLSERLDTLGEPSWKEWTATVVLLAATFLLWLALYQAAKALTRRTGRARWRSGHALRKSVLPLATTAAAVAFHLGASRVLLLTGPTAANLMLAAEVIGLAAGAWLLLQVASATTLMLSEHYIVPLTADDPENRRTKTTIYVARRLALVLIALLCIGYILMRVGLFESFGLSVLASAGALGVLVAIAARPLLGNMVAGLQIALTDPVRIGDVVVYNDHWATVEDISFAHLVLRTWLETRVIVPHSDFLARPFENWSKDGEAVRRIVKIPVDYRLDVNRVRTEVDTIVSDDPRSAGEPPLVEVVDVDETAAVLWIWVSGTDAFTSWSLHNDVRESVIRLLKDLDGGAYLPRRRQLIVRDSDLPPCDPE